MQLSRNFSYTEFIRSETAIRRGIENIPNAECITSAVLLCNKVLEPIRELVGKPIRITSGYRCPEVNTIIGGSETSQHMKGEAADIEVEGVNAPLVFWAILDSDIPYDQLIGEFGEWIHVSYRHDPRYEALVAMRNNEGAVEYRRITTKEIQ